MGRRLTGMGRPPAPGSRYRPELIKARERCGLTQAQLAEVVDVDPGLPSRWERAIRTPDTDVQPRLAEALKVTESDLSRMIERVEERPAPPVDGARKDRSSDDAVDRELMRLVQSSAAGSRTLTHQLLATDVSDDLLCLWRDSLIHLAADFVTAPMADVVGELATLRDEIVASIAGHIPKRHVGDCIALAGMATVVLAHACHVLGHPRAALAHAAAARALAGRADHVELHAWAWATQALIWESTGLYAHALAAIQSATKYVNASQHPGTAALRVPAYHARIAARQGNVSVARSALRKAEAARAAMTPDSDLDRIGGILTFPPAKLSVYAGQVAVLVGHPAQAERPAQQAVADYLTGPAHARSYGDLALARLDIAAARLAGDDLDGVQDVLGEVLRLDAPHRIAPLAGSLCALGEGLRAPRYARVALARDIRDRIAAFQPSMRISEN
jgi:transcriptional regulator with XRE-family HTH domain